MRRYSFIRTRIFRIIIFIVAVFLLGIGGYMFIENFSLMEAFYMTAITLTTTGFGEVRPLSDAGRLFTIVMLFLGVGVIAYVLGSSVEFIMGSFSGQLARRRMLRSIQELQDHVIICGFGRVGRSAATSLLQGGYQVVVVEKDPGLQTHADQQATYFLEGDATSDELLQAAGIAKAGGLLVSTGDDAVNLFIVLSARGLNSDLFIVARSSKPENERKMRQAGANRVVSPHRIGGQHMANIMIRPHVTDFFDVVTLDNGQELWLEEMVLAEEAPINGRTIGDADIRRQTGVTIVAIVRSQAGSTITPRAGTLLETGDQLIVLGTREQLTDFEPLTRAPGDSGIPVSGRSRRARHR